MNGQLDIRPARPEDQPALLEIVWQTVMVDPVRNAEIIARPEVVEVPIEQLEAGTACVAELDGAIIGFATVLPRADGDAELDGLFVSPEAQRAGIGRALVGRAKRLASEQGANALHVIANPAAVAFYQAMGFVTTGMTQTQFEPAPTMALRLDGEARVG